MSRISPADVGLPSTVRVDKAGTNAGFSDLHVIVDAPDIVCPRCGRAMTGHGSFSKRMAHVVGETPCELTVKIKRYRCKRCNITQSAIIPFASVVSPAITDALETHVIELLRRRQTITEVAYACNISHDTVRLIIDSVHIKKPTLPTILLTDEIHAISYRESDTGKQVCVFWACAYDGASGYLVDVIEGRNADDMDQWFEQFGLDERKHVAFFCSDMYDIYLNAAKKWCRYACIGVDRFHVAKIGVSCIDDARCRLQKGASNGADIKRRHRKLAANRGKRRREYGSEPWIEVEKKTICDILAICDSKHSCLRQAYLVLQLYYIWQDHPWADRCECEKALDNWISKACGLEVPEMKRFAKTVAKYKQYLVTATISHINTARAESTNDKIKELKRKSRGFGTFKETRKRLLLAFGAPDAVEGATAYERRKKAQAAAFASKASKHKKKR